MTGMSSADKSRRYREAHPERARENTRRWAAANPEKIKSYNEANRDLYRAARRRYRVKLKDTVLDHYGRACACCGSTERLSIDHVDGTGAEHRRQINNGRPAPSEVLHRWLIANGFPPGFQVLCHGCNRSKSNGARCRLDHGGAS